MTPPLLIEADHGVMRPDDPLYLHGATEVPNVGLEWFGDWNKGADCVAEVLAAHARHLDRPRCVKLCGLMLRTADATNTDTGNRPTADQTFAGIQAGILDYSADLAVLKPFGDAIGPNYALDYILVDDEGVVGPWINPPTADTPANARVGVQAAYDRNWSIMLRCFHDDSVWHRLPAVLQAIPRTDTAIHNAFDFTKDRAEGYPTFNAVNRAWAHFWTNIKMRTLRTLLNEAGITQGKVVQTFCGCWNKLAVDPSGWQQPAPALPANWCSSYEIYGAGRQVTASAITLATGKNPMLTFYGGDTPQDISDRLTSAAPQGAILWVNDAPRNADSLLPVIAQYTGTAA